VNVGHRLMDVALPNAIGIGNHRAHALELNRALRHWSPATGSMKVFHLVRHAVPVLLEEGPHDPPPIPAEDYLRAAGVHALDPPSEDVRLAVLED